MTSQLARSRCKPQHDVRGQHGIRVANNYLAAPHAATSSAQPSADPSHPQVSALRDDADMSAIVSKASDFCIASLPGVVAPAKHIPVLEILAGATSRARPLVAQAV